MDYIEKQPYEEFTTSVDFSRNLASGETIIGYSVTVEDKYAADTTSTITDQTTLRISGGKVLVKVQAGSEALGPYKLTFRCSTTAGHKWEYDLTMRVRGV